MKIFKKTIFFIVILISFFLFPQATHAEINLVKTADSAAVYYLEGSQLHAFPTASVYKTWYAGFSPVVTVSKDFFIDLNLAGNITVRAGKNLVKFATSPKVYALEPGGLLRHIASEEITRAFYGSNWPSKVLILPNAFFGDYILGAPLKNKTDLPDGAVIKVKGVYYWKNKNILLPFKNWEAVTANGFDSTDVIEQENLYYKIRNKVIKGSENFISDILVQPYLSSKDCEIKNLKAAFIFLYDKQYQSSELEKIKKLKISLPDKYSWATYYLAKINDDEPVYQVKTTPIYYENNKIHLDELLLDFYDAHPDKFDFIFLFNNFLAKEEFVAHHVIINNFVLGSGKSNVFSSFNYGSAGKLKAVINMGNIKKYAVDSAEKLEQSLYYMIHELAHQWSGSATFIDETGKENLSLQKKDLIHWNDVVSFISPLGGWGFQNNGDGTFASTMGDSGLLKRFSELDLYLMGLIPSFSVQPFYYIIPSAPDSVSETMRGVKQTVTIEQIVEAEGLWGCKVD